ncbi:MAG: DUF362 domain-containing protein [Anaerolineales bacterium]
MAKLGRRKFLRWLLINLASIVGAKTLSGCDGRMVDISGLIATPSHTPESTSTRPPGPTATSQQPGAEPTDLPATGEAAPTSPPDPTATRPRPTSTQTQQPGPPTSQPTSTDTPRPQPTDTPPAPSPTATATRSGPAYLGVARNGEPRDLVRSAVSAIGGMRAFVRSGDRVLIKPNICVSYRSYEYAATTNPWVVGALVELAFEAGAGRVLVMDYPFGGTCEDAYQRSGIQQQVLAAGGEMESISQFKFVHVDLPQGRDLTSCEIYEEILNADVVINVPIAKHHSLARLTLGMKNLMGTISDRPAMHTNIGQRLADLTSGIRPALTVVDAVRILLRNGPTGGNLADVSKIDTVIASADIVAADSYAATLFGRTPSSLSYVTAGVAMGLGRSDLENLDIQEINLSA